MRTVIIVRNETTTEAYTGFKKNVYAFKSTFTTT